jgi:hypothetical protein
LCPKGRLILDDPAAVVHSGVVFEVFVIERGKELNPRYTEVKLGGGVSWEAVLFELMGLLVM